MSGGLHEDFRARTDDTRASERSFGVTIGAALALVGLIKCWRAWPDVLAHTGPWWIAAAVPVLALAFWWPASLRPFNRLWFKLGVALHAIVSPLVMALLFFCSVTPMALLLRALGKDLLNLRRDEAATSYWIPRNPAGPLQGTMKNQF